jgi:hypothetical protein
MEGSKGVRESNKTSWIDQSKVPTVGIHWETPLSINLNINNEKQTGL